MKTPYAQQRNARQENTSALLFDLWRNAPLSRAMLAQRSGLTKATVSAICDELAALNLINEVGQDRSGIGRPGNLLELNPQARGAIGVELSTNYVAALLSDFCGQTLWRQTLIMPENTRQEAALEQAETLLTAAIQHARQRDLPLLGIGVAAAGPVDTDRGVIVGGPALNRAEIALKPLWEARFSLPVIVENKARTAAMAEALHGSAQGIQNFIYVSQGTGVDYSVDVAVMIDGILFRGAHGVAADAGHMVVDPEGEVCACGQRGCWQAQGNVAREVALVRARLAKGEPSVLAKMDVLDHRVIHQAALEGDRLAIDVLKTVLWGNVLGILNLISLFDPELVLIGIADAALPAVYKQRILTLNAMPETDTLEAIRQQMHARGKTPPALRYVSYGGDIYMLGAASLLVDRFLREPPVAGA